MSSINSCFIRAAATFLLSNDIVPHNKHVKLGNFEYIGRRSVQHIEHTIVRGVISLEEIVAENLSRVKACFCDEFVVGDVLR